MLQPGRNSPKIDGPVGTAVVEDLPSDHNRVA